MSETSEYPVYISDFGTRVNCSGLVEARNVLLEQFSGRHVSLRFFTKNKFLSNVFVHVDGAVIRASYGDQAEIDFDELQAAMDAP